MSNLDLTCEVCHKPIRNGIDLPVVLAWEKRDNSLPDHIGLKVSRAVHIECNKTFKTKPLPNGGNKK